MASTCGQSPEPVGCPRGGLRGTLGDESALAPPAAAERVSSPHQDQRPGCCSLAYLLQALSSSEPLRRGPLLPPPRPQSGRSVGEKVGEQAAWQWGWVQHHESRTAPREPLVETELQARGPRGSHLPGCYACDYLSGGPPARRPSFASLPGGCWRGPNAPWAFSLWPGLTRFSGSLCCSCSSSDLGRATLQPAGGGRAPGWLGDPLPASLAPQQPPPRAAG